MRNQKLAELLHQYFELGVAEGREGRNHDTEAGDAQRVLTEIEVEIAAMSAAEPVKTPFQVASQHIPEARVSLFSRAIRQGLNDYGWKNFGTIPEVLAGYIIQAETAEKGAHPKKYAPSVAVKALKWNPYRAETPFGWYQVNDQRDVPERELNGRPPFLLCGSRLDYSRHLTLEAARAAAQADYETRVLSALSSQVQDVAEYERREQVCKEAALWQWERSLKRPDLDEKARVTGAIEAYKRQAFAFTMLAAAPAKQEG